jgi:hypothetical protein
MRVREKNRLHLLQVCFGFFQAQLQINDLTVQYFQRQRNGAPNFVAAYTAGRIRLSARVVPVGEFFAVAGVDLWSNFIRPSGPRRPGQGHKLINYNFTGKRPIRKSWSALQADLPCR